MPDIDRTKFAYAVAGKLRGLGIDGPKSAHKAFAAIKPPTWSRIGYGRTLSTGNYLAVCRVLSLDPFDFLDMTAENAFAHQPPSPLIEWQSKRGRPAKQMETAE